MQSTYSPTQGQDSCPDLLALAALRAETPVSITGSSFAADAAASYWGRLRLDGLKTRVYGAVHTGETATESARALAAVRTAHLDEHQAETAPFAWLPVPDPIAGLVWSVSSRPVGRWSVAGRSAAGVDFEFYPRGEKVPTNYGVLTVHFGAVWWLTRTLAEAQAFVPALAAALGVASAVHTVSEVHVCCDMPERIAPAGAFGRWRGYGASHFAPHGSNVDPDGWSTVRPGSGRPLDVVTYDKLREVKSKGLLHWLAWFDRVEAVTGAPVSTCWRLEVRARRDLLTERFGVDRLENLGWPALQSLWRHTLGGKVSDPLTGDLSYRPGYLRLLTTRAARADDLARRLRADPVAAQRWQAANPTQSLPTPTRPELQTCSPLWEKLRAATHAQSTNYAPDYAPDAPAMLVAPGVGRKPHRQASAAAGNLRSALAASVVNDVSGSIETAAREVEALALVSHAADRSAIASALRALADGIESNTRDLAAESVMDTFRKSIKKKMKPVTAGPNLALASCLLTSSNSLEKSTTTVSTSSLAVPAQLMNRLSGGSHAEPSFLTDLLNGTSSLPALC